MCVWGLQGGAVAGQFETFRTLLAHAAGALTGLRRVFQRFHNTVRWDLTLEGPLAREAALIIQRAASARGLRAREARPHGERKRREDGIEQWRTVRQSVGTFASLNVDSLRERVREVAALASEHSVGVIALQETKRSAEKMAAKPLLLRGGYTFVERPRDKNVKGAHGLALGAAEHFQLQELCYSGPFALWARVLPPAGRKDWIVACVYIPGRGRTNRARALADVQHAYAAVTARFPAMPVLMMGDWNMSRGDLERKLQAWELGASVLPFSGPAGTYKIPRGGTSDIDHFVANAAAKRLLAAPEVITKYEEGTHYPISVRPAAGAAAGGVPLAAVLQRRVLDRTVLLKQCAALATSNQFAALAELIPDDDAAPVPAAGAGAVPAAAAGAVAANPPAPAVFTRFTTTLSLAAAGIGALKSEQRRVGPARYTFSPATKSLIERRRELEFQLRTGRVPERDRAAAKQRVRELLRQARKAQRADETKQFVKQLREALPHRAARDPSPFWRLIRRHTRGEASQRDGGTLMVTPVVHRGERVTAPADVLAAWTEHSRAVATAPEGRARWPQVQWAAQCPLPQRPEFPGMDDDIHWAEVVDVVRSMPLKKAEGPDGIPAEALRALIVDDKGRELTAETAGLVPPTPGGKALLAAVRDLFASEVLPEAARSATVVMIPKAGGEKSNMNDYRGISLMSVPLKLVSSIVANRISAAAVEGGAVRAEQAGFRTREECMAQVCTLAEVAQRRARLAKPTYAAFIDFRKAFDSVPHGALLHCIESAGVRGRCLSFVRALYTNPSFRVRVGHLLSDRVELQQGVRQGDPLSPILFNLFINSILDDMQGVPVPGLADPLAGLLFADDVAVLGEQPEQLNGNLARLGAWADKWSMTVNHGKCGVMLFGHPSRHGKGRMLSSDVKRARKAAALPGLWKVQGASIPYVTKYKYLGVLIDCDLTLSEHVKERAARAENALRAARPILSHRFIPATVKRHVYMSIVRPTLVYGAELLGGMGKIDLGVARLQRVQIEAARRIVGRQGRSRFPAAPLQADLDLPPVVSVLLAAKARALLKYPSLSTKIAPLLAARLRLPTKGENAASVPLWSSSGRAILSRLRPGWAALAPDKAADAVRTASTDSKINSELQDTSSGTLYHTLGLRASIGYIHAASSSVSSAPAINELAAARCGALFCGYMAAGAKKAAPEYAQRCCACEQPVRDTLSHITASCGAYAKERADHLLPLWERCVSIKRAAGGHPGALPASVEDLSADELTALAVGSSGDASCLRMWLGPPKKRGDRGIGVVAADAAMPEVAGEALLPAGAASPDSSDGDSSASSVSAPLPTGGRAGFWSAASFYGAVLPAHRRRVASACDNFITNLRANGPALVGAAVAQDVPNGANAAHAVGPPAANLQPGGADAPIA